MTAIDIITVILGSSLITSIITFLLHRKTEKITADVKSKFEHLQEKLTTDLQWKRDACRTMGKIYFHLYRTRKALSRYNNVTQTNKFIETEVFKDSNTIIRNLILNEGYLIHPDLTDEANSLIQHYDDWLEKLHSMRVENNTNDKQVFNHSFPHSAEKMFKKYYLKLWNELYTLEIKTSSNKIHD